MNLVNHIKRTLLYGNMVKSCNRSTKKCQKVHSIDTNNVSVLGGDGTSSNVGWNDGSTFGDLLANKLRFDVFANGTEAHLFRDDALTGIVHLRVVLVAAIAAFN